MSSKFNLSSLKQFEVCNIWVHSNINYLFWEKTCEIQFHEIFELFFQAYIVNEILDNGFNAAVQGYLQAQVTFNYNSMAEFETECELFSYHGEEMARIGKNYASKKYDQFSLNIYIPQL